jgi:hypothetical protein
MWSIVGILVAGETEVLWEKTPQVSLDHQTFYIYGFRVKLRPAY